MSIFWKVLHDGPCLWCSSQKFLTTSCGVFFFFAIKADKCDSRCMSESTIGVINLRLKMYRHFYRNLVKEIERN